MPDDSTQVSADPTEAELAARAAWLYHVGNFKQSEVAEQLSVSINKVNRLIATAERDGIVRVMIEGPIAGCQIHERALKDRFGLAQVRVVPDLGAPGGALPPLAQAAAQFLNGVLASCVHRVIGVGHGRSLAAAVLKLPVRRVANLEFVSLVGSIASRLSSCPFEVVYELADRTGTTAHLIPVPLYVDAPADRAVMLRQSNVRLAFEKASHATLSLVGIGSVEEKRTITDVPMGTMTAGDLAAVRDAGAAGEVLGTYYEAGGRKLDLPIHDRLIAVAPESLAGRQVVAVAGGAQKARAIRAILNAGFLTGLITTDITAQRILERK